MFGSTGDRTIDSAVEALDALALVVNLEDELE
jgi:hypothetical protein